MKKMIVLGMALVIVCRLSGQHDSTLSPAERYRVFPPAKFLLPDSATYFSKTDLPKNKKVLLMAFNPDCDHCQHETEDIIKNISQFKGITILMATMASLSEMNAFIASYNLHRFKNIIVVKDIGYFLPTYFQFQSLPFLALYNKKLSLISGISGSIPVERILKEFEKER